MVHLKIAFSGKAIERLNLSSILRKHMDLIPEDFKYRDPPTVLYKRTMTIGSKLFNYKHVVDNVLTDNWTDGNCNSCDCQNSMFKDHHHQHIITGDLRIVEIPSSVA